MIATAETSVLSGLILLAISVGFVWLVARIGQRLFTPDAHRCRWCQRVYTANGYCTDAEPPLVVGHGLCPKCSAESDRPVHVHR